MRAVSSFRPPVPAPYAATETLCELSRRRHKWSSSRGGSSRDPRTAKLDSGLHVYGTGSFSQVSAPHVRLVILLQSAGAGV